MKGKINRTFSYRKTIKDLDIILELEKRGVSGKVSGENVQINCPIHQEKNPSMGIYISDKKKGLCNCFGCGWRGNFFSLIATLDNISYDQAIKLYFKNDINSKELLELKTFLEEMLKKKKVKTEESIKYYNMNFLDKFKKPYGDYLDYLIDERKLTKEIIEKFNIRCCDGKGTGYSKIWKNRIIIPIIDYNGKLAGISARYIYDCEKKNKVRKIKDSDISKVLYGLQNIKKGSPLIGVEGEIDVIYCQQHFIPAIRTSKFLSKNMINQIVNFTDEFILSLDGDVPFINSDPKRPKDCISYQKKVLSKYMSVEIIQPPKDRDQNDLSSEELEKLYKKYINKKYFK